MGGFQVYLVALLVLVAGIWLVKKVVGCVVRAVVMTIVLAILAVLYLYFM